MSELVHRHLESMTEEIQEMLRTKLYSAEETRFILKKRKEFEYKVNGVSKNLQDFKDYIQYEKVLLKHIKSRREKHRIVERKGSVEFRILKRIKSLYEIALQRFSTDFSLCLSYFKFCKLSNYNSAASMAVQNMIKNYSYNPEVWQIAAAWHSYDRRDVPSALNVLHKGLTIHKDSQTLYTGAINLELQNLDNNPDVTDAENKEREETCGLKIQTYIQSAFKHINDCKFYFELLRLLEPHSFTKSIQNMIIDWLLEVHKCEENVWHVLAQRELQGIHYGLFDQSGKNSTKSCLERCFKKYQEGLANVHEDHKAALWMLYLDCLIDVQQQSKVATMLKTKSLKEALEKASCEINLDEKYYVVWAELVNEDEALEVLEQGTTALPHSLELWKLRLKYAILKDSVSEVNQMFKLGVLALKEKSVGLWLMTIRYHILTSSFEIIKSIYEDGVRQPKEVSEILKPQYIEWLALVKDIEETRKVYNILSTEQPYCKELHMMMAKLESMEIEPDLEALVHVHEMACKQFGKDDVDVWISYIQFCTENYEARFINGKISQIFSDACNRLPSLLRADFKEKYAQFIGGVMN